MDDGALGPRDVIIAPVEDRDVGELLTLQRAAYVTEARRHGDVDLPPLTQTLAELTTELQTARAFKATAGHRIVGAVRGRVDHDVLHIGRLIVAPDWQRRSIGSRLLQAIEDVHRDQALTAALFTGSLSTDNLAMYRRRGYRECRREQLRPGVVVVHLTKPL